MIEIHRQGMEEAGEPVAALASRAGLESAVDAAQNVYWYQIGATSDPLTLPQFALLAATYWVHIALAHSFQDGNNRAAFMSCRAFLLVNGLNLKLGFDQALEISHKVSQRIISREELGNLILPNISPAR